MKGLKEPKDTATRKAAKKDTLLAGWLAGWWLLLQLPNKYSNNNKAGIQPGNKKPPPRASTTQPQPQPQPQPQSHPQKES
ncbi:GL21277 [Drosophila persimilis]|uniref:GL21277 n=1 Tax=Drosophila persimilis TaxID=7234 RepID=B4HCF6_DROPE|nr:GL21277 [Drosophila persimilis]